MKFIPCQDQCTKEGTHCEGCGRSFEEIKQTKQLVASVVKFAREQGYENSDEFARYFGKKVSKKLEE